MRALWKGSISFGLVSIPVEVFPATEQKTVSFHQLHDRDRGRIRYRKVCELCGEEVANEHIVKGFEYEGGEYVVITDEELESLPLPSRRVIDIAYFVEASSIDCIFFQRTYYLAPSEAGQKAYRLLQEVFARTSRVAVAKVSFRDKEHLAAIRLLGNMLVLQTMFWPDEIRAAEFPVLDADVDVRSKELAMAESFVESLTEDWKPDELQDLYRESLHSLIERKIDGQDIARPEEPVEGAEVVDLLEALSASVRAAEGRRRGRADDREGKAASI